MEDNIFSQRLREVRKEKGMSQEDLGKLVGVAGNTVSIWELGKRMPEQKTITKLAMRLLVNEQYLLGTSDFKDLDDMMAELRRLRRIKPEDSEDGIYKESKLLKMYEDFSIETQKIVFETIEKTYEIEKGSGKLRSQQKKKSNPN